MGWLGVLAGYFSWLANPIFFIAIISKKQKIVISLSFLAHVFSLSFLTKGQLVVSEAPTFESIVAYGLGYFLWVLAFVTLLLGEILNTTRISAISKLASLIVTILVLSIFYGLYYSQGESSIYHVFLEREQKFSELCSIVKEEQYNPVTDINGVFIDNVPGSYFRNISGQKHGAYGGSLISYVRNGHYEFEERKPYNSKETTLPYIRIYSTNPNERIPVSELESNYSVTSINLASDLPRALGIRSYKILIKSLVSNEIYAETSFVSITNERKICAPTTTSSYSVPDFVFNTLNLEKINTL